MVARGLLPIRAWFIAVLTPIIVFLKMRMSHRFTPTHKHCTHMQRNSWISDINPQTKPSVFYDVSEAEPVLLFYFMSSSYFMN